MGSTAQVREALSRFFPELSFQRFANQATNSKELRSSVRDTLQFWKPFKLVGPRAPYIFQGIREGDGWTMDIKFDDTDSVDLLHLSFYGNIGQAEATFGALLEEYQWELEIY